MKKGLYIIVLLLAIISLTGCGSKTLTCTREKKESIYSLNEKVTASYGMFGLKKVNMNMEMKLTNEKIISASNLGKTIKASYEELEKYGASVNVKSKDGLVIVDIDLDLKKIDSKKLKELNLYDTEESYDDAKKSFKKLGYTCK